MGRLASWMSGSAALQVDICLRLLLLARLIEQAGLPVEPCCSTLRAARAKQPAKLASAAMRPRAAAKLACSADTIVLGAPCTLPVPSSPCCPAQDAVKYGLLPAIPPCKIMVRRCVLQLTVHLAETFAYLSVPDSLACYTWLPEGLACRS